MSPDKILFLSFLSISDFKLDHVRDLYHELAIELATELKLEKPRQFPELRQWFEEDKIRVSEGTIEFSHISFYEAWEYVLNDNGCPSNVSVELFSKVLSALLKLDNLKEAAQAAIVKYIEYLPSFLVSDLVNDLGRQKVRRLTFDSLLINKKFYNRNALEFLTAEDRFLLHCVINQQPDSKITVNRKFRWDKVFRSLLRVEEKFRNGMSDRLLLAIASSPELVQINTLL